jgi:acyl-CoA reductase-like NAD-dependent aldehyde dehydrogenase
MDTILQSISDTRSLDEKSVLNTEVFLKGDIISCRNRSVNELYLIEEGVVRLELHDPAVNASAFFSYCGAGEVLVDLVFDGNENQLFTAVADTDVQVYVFENPTTNVFLKNSPKIAAALSDKVCKQVQKWLEIAKPHLQKQLFSNVSDTEVDIVVDNASEAQEIYHDWKDDKIDRLISAIANVFLNNVESYAEQEELETKLGNRIDKTHKLRIVCTKVLNDLVGIKTFGKISDDNVSGTVAEYASPVGVIFAMVPVTNPVPNSLYKTLSALKTRNSVIFSFHRAATNIGVHAINQIRKVLVEHGAPENLIQCVPLPSNRTRVKLFMSHNGVDLVLATGGSAMVKAAYSSGNPTYGVGAGNVPVWICDDVDLNKTAKDIVYSKSYDNGIICGSENNLIVFKNVAKKLTLRLEENNAAVVTEKEKERFIFELFDMVNGGLKAEFIGKSGQELAVIGGINRSYVIKVIVIPAHQNEINILGKEKLAPILTMFESEGESGLNLSLKLLKVGGAGHTAAIHTNNKVRLEKFSEVMPVGRIMVNTPAVHGMLGLTTDLETSFMLGSGTFGGNITTDGITWRHLLNIKRIAFDVRL